MTSLWIGIIKRIRTIERGVVWMIKDKKIVSVEETATSVKVRMRAEHFGICNFIFDEHNIVCYGDIESFCWNTTWYANKEIVKGNCYAHQPVYFVSKLENEHKLMEFSPEHFEKAIEDVKEEYLESCDTKEEKQEFLEKWNSNAYLLHDVDGYRLDGVDDFCSEMEIDIDYDEFFELPPHYNIAVEFLQFIEDYFKDKTKEMMCDE